MTKDEQMESLKNRKNIIKNNLEHRINKDNRKKFQQKSAVTFLEREKLEQMMMPEEVISV